MRFRPSDPRKPRRSSEREPDDKPRYRPRRRRVLVEEEEKPRQVIGLGRQANFLSIAVFIALAIAAVWVAVGRFFAGQATSADPANLTQVNLGRGLYQQHCAYCHGANREGQSAEATSGKMAPALDQTGQIVKATDRAVFEIVKYGGQPFAPPGAKSQMPGYEFTLSNAQIWAVLAFLKNRWPEPVRDAQAQINAKAEAEAE